MSAPSKRPPIALARRDRLQLLFTIRGVAYAILGACEARDLDRVEELLTEALSLIEAGR